MRDAYGEAEVILEYGGGGSTVLASSLPGKLVLTVESDLAFSRALQNHVDAARLPSAAVVHHADIGETGAWGRPVSDAAWRRFHRYPLEIWDMPFFRPPDLVLIDGRFRPACFLTVMLRATRPVRVLFDDFPDRPHYRRIDEIATPVRMVGRMAEFRIEPDTFPMERLTYFVGVCGQITFADQYPRQTESIDPPLPWLDHSSTSV